MVLEEFERRDLKSVSGWSRDARTFSSVIALTSQSREEVADLVAGLAEEAAHRRTRRRNALIVCVGRTAQSWKEVAVSLRNAHSSLPTMRALPPLPWHDAGAPTVDELLWTLRGNDELRRFAHARLLPLIEHDARRQPKLLPTLAAYCEHGGRKTDAAQRLQIERQSLYHRLNRIEEILSVDLSDGVTVLTLHLALRALGHIQANGEELSLA